MRRTHLLETIYEVDEEPFRDDATAKSCKEQSQASIYMCGFMITGCFLILAFIIFVSLNPHYLISQSTLKQPKSIINVSLHSNNKFELSNDIINYLNMFAYEVNKPVDLQANPIGFLTSPFSNLSSPWLKRFKRNGLLWIYGHVKYPRSCLLNTTCKDAWRSKLTVTFDELSGAMRTTNLDDRRSTHIHLDWCTLIENTTSATFVSLATTEEINRKASATVTSFDPLICVLDSTEFRSKTLDDLILQDGTVLINFQAGTAPSNSEASVNDTDTRSKPADAKTCCGLPSCPSSLYGDAAHCSNDGQAPHPLLGNLL